MGHSVRKRGKRMKKHQEIKCNQCGRALHVERGILKEDALILKKEWGYFSEKDLEVHELVLCEACYDTWIQGFVLPVRITGKQEVLS